MMPIRIYISFDGRVTTNHHTDYKGKDLAACIGMIEAEEGRTLQWRFALSGDQICLEGS